MLFHHFAPCLAVLLCGSIAAGSASAACDEFVSRIIANHVRAPIEDLDCSVLSKAGLDKKGHALKSVCYESSGATSHVKIDASLNCHGSNESVVSKVFGSQNRPSVSENVTAEAEVKGADCALLKIEIKPSGELGKLFAKRFDVNQKARVALEQGLAEICRR